MDIRYLTRAELFAQGLSRREIADAVGSGHLIHARRDRYLPRGTPDAVVHAVRVGGRATCLTLLRLCGVFVHVNDRLHVHVAPTASRLRAPRPHRGNRRPLEQRDRRGVRLHWLPLYERPGTCAVVSAIDALSHSVRCQSPRAAIATLDSALNRGLIDSAGFAEVFAMLPARYAVLVPLVDGRAQSGPETFVRLIARSLGCGVVVQAVIDGVGRVDLLLDGWLVVECDSKEFHSSWSAQVEDRRRDIALAARGYATLRVTATMVMDQPDVVRAALHGLLSARPR